MKLIHSVFEYQANEFAGRLLVPYDELKREIDKVYQKIKDEGLTDLLNKNRIIY